MALERRTPLGRGSKPLARRRILPRGSTSDLRRAPIAPVSDRRRAENVERRGAMVAAFGQHPPCHAGPTIAAADPGHRCQLAADDAHEILTRGRGGSILDPDNVLPVCRPCHHWIGAHPAAALELGLVASQFTPRES